MSSAIDQQDIKREKILEAAYQRFLHYGYAKTTMNEIAGDLSFSKALLYYYFPDKSQLYIAVMRKLATDYLDKLASQIHGFDDLKSAFVYQINIQHNFIVDNYNFFDYFRVNEQNLPETIWDIIGEIHNAETDLLTSAIRAEVEKGRIKPVENPEAVIDLLLDALHGVRVRSASYKKNTFPKKEHLEEIRSKRLLLAEIFIKGLN
ncbi:TetR/AcrR family transcriptional regulator [Mucilaginibacter auburnensis]|uniref:TetR/AcrR family transcriptional repressor of mexJK operon n=1 Tax=Mucilaginibacter auburnensis TaxID=1457233 RepID=A0A2H9VVQ5_9SPHI|nr:TetR/AcrR family transcriptional regulator [Mucilaginibacter auburnensis]PJJ84862.1 TetR/AcrR family transcriptional repressor of mexJK operon [Mucilaginibacter auburnensis]